MKMFHENIICLNLKFVESSQDVHIFLTKFFQTDADENLAEYIFRLKDEAKVRKVFLSNLGDLIFIDWSPRKGFKDINLSDQMIDMIGLMNSATPKTKNVGHGLVMIEPGRFTKESLKEFFINNCGVDNISEEILMKNKKGISKFWVFMPSQEIVFFKKKGENTIDISHFVENSNLVEVVGDKKSDFNFTQREKPKVLKITKEVATTNSISAQQEPILDMDGILDKISEFGMDSLLKEELEFLKGIK